MSKRKLKRYLVFIVEEFEPSGGIADLRYALDNVPSDCSLHGSVDIDFFGSIYVVDSKSMRICRYFKASGGRFSRVQEMESEVKFLPEMAPAIVGDSVELKSDDDTMNCSGNDGLDFYWWVSPSK